jgi:hypothetical protein
MPFAWGRSRLCQLRPPAIRSCTDSAVNRLVSGRPNAGQSLQGLSRIGEASCPITLPFNVWQADCKQPFAIFLCAVAILIKMARTCFPFHLEAFDLRQSDLAKCSQLRADFFSSILVDRRYQHANCNRAIPRSDQTERSPIC